MNTILLWIIPPVGGAFIGYVTNVVAIKMLFRPLKEVRFLGIRVPFTPGILPRQRHQLADSIGRMVQGELLTPEIVRQRLAREDVQQTIHHAVARYTETLLNRSLYNVMHTSAENTLVNSFTELMATFFRGFIDSPGFNALIEEFFNALHNQNNLSPEFLNYSIRDIIGNEQWEKLQNIAGKSIEQHIKTNAAASLDILMPIAAKVYPQVVDLCIQFLQKEKTHKELEAQGSIFLSKIMLKLNSLQRMFLSAGQYDKALHNRMPEIIDDLINQLDQVLHDDTIRERLFVLFRESGEKFLAAEESYPRISRFITDLVMKYANKSLRELIQGLNQVNLHALGPQIIQFIKKSIAHKETNTPAEQPFFLRLITGFLEKNQDMNLATLCAIDSEKKEKLDSLISREILILADKQIDAALKSINVRTLVSERIDALDMIAVEHIILDIMANQLKWINVFGGILGALIGLFQAGFSWFTRHF